MNYNTVRILIIILLLLSNIKIHAQNNFCMNELSVNDLLQFETLVASISYELHRHIQEEDVYFRYIDINGFVQIFELKKDNYDKIFFIIYRDGIIYHYYYLIQVIVENRTNEIKNINISNIEMQQNEMLPPFNL